MILYYVFVTLGTLVCAFVFKSALNVSVASLAPILGMAILIFVALMHRQADKDMREGFRTAYFIGDVFLNREEEDAAMSFWTRACLIGAPLHLPLIFFGGEGVKTVGVLLIVMLSLAVGSLSFLLKHRKDVRQRMDAEAEELRHQREREEQGKM